MEPEADPDYDRLTNLEEFFHGSLPQASTDAPLDGAVVLENGDFLYEITFPRRRELTGVAYRAEAGVSLLTWNTASPESETVTELDAQREMVCLRFRAIEDLKRQFFQIVVEVVE